MNTNNNRELEIIEDILDEFDFTRVQQVMEALDWTWFESGVSPAEVPTLGKLRKKARFLLKECMNVPEFSTATGGLWASKKTFDGEPYYRLQFVVASWDNYE